MIEQCFIHFLNTLPVTDEFRSSTSVIPTLRKVEVLVNTVAGCMLKVGSVDKHMSHNYVYRFGGGRAFLAVYVCLFN